MTTTPLPPYVPPHLRGQLQELSRAADGSVSLVQPAPSAGAGTISDRVTLTPEQYARTFDQPTRFGDLSTAMTSQYSPLQRKTPARQMNDAIAASLRSALGWGTSSQGKAVGTIGLLAALGGGLGSYAWDRHQGDASPSIGKAMLMSLLAGGLGAAGTAWGQTRHNQREKFLSKSASMEVASALIRLLEGDPSLSRYDKAKILAALAEASDSDRGQLYRLLRTSAGVGAGALAARFLGAKGLLPMLAGGILGGMLASGDPAPRRNAQGQLSITNYL